MAEVLLFVNRRNTVIKFKEPLLTHLGKHVSHSEHAQFKERADTSTCGHALFSIKICEVCYRLKSGKTP